MWVIARAPIVRPWKEPSIATILPRPVRRLSLKAASLASVPEFAKKTRAGVPGASRVASPTSRSPSSIWGGEAKRFEMCPSVAACPEIASRTAGWAWPSACTASPASRSV